MKLKDAVEIWRQEVAVSANSYEWYRKDALKRGKVRIGELQVEVYRSGRIWCVDDEALQNAIRAHRARLEFRKKISDDYAKGVFYGSAGDAVDTDWGGYEVRSRFHFAWSWYERGRKRSNGDWRCNKCLVVARFATGDREERGTGTRTIVCPNCGESDVIASSSFD